MLTQSLLGTQLPLGKLIFIAWVSASILMASGAVFKFDFDSSPETYALEAGLLFGYYLSITVIVKVVSVLPGLLIVSYRKLIVPEGSVVRLMNVLSMFIAFTMYGETAKNTLGTVGLFVALIFYIAGKFQFMDD